MPPTPPVHCLPAHAHPLIQVPQGAITDVPGIEVGHSTETRRPTGCTVVMAREGAVAGVDVRGAAPGTRETDVLHPSNLVEKIHAVVLSGGSAWGLDAATGAVRWLEEQGVGLDVGVARLPLVSAAVLFDLQVGDARIRPDAAAGYAACVAAGRQPPAEGNVGAGTGASVGKLFGMQWAMKGGIGTASVCVDGITVGALIACNAVGDVVDRMALTPVALAEGTVLAHHLFGEGGKSAPDYELVPTAVFSHPQVGTVGLSEELARERFGAVQVFQSGFRPLTNRMGAEPENVFLKLIVSKADQRVRGVHMVGEGAGELMQGFAVALQCGATKQQFDSTIGIHPTVAEELVTMREPVRE